MNQTFSCIKKISAIITLIILMFCCIAILYEVYKFHAFNAYLNTDHYYKTDSIAGHIHSSNYSKIITWTEHEKGQFEMVTNNMGFRENEDTKIEKAKNTKRILVTGDSHTDGVLNNIESFPNILETKLNIGRDTISYEIINGGIGFYSLKNYAGFLEKYKFLKPDVFIVSIYTGNDFIENILYEQDGIEVLESLQLFYFRIKKKLFHFRTQLSNSQSTNQILYFKTYPKKINESIAITKIYLKEIINVCEKENVQFIVVFIPTKFDVEEKHKILLKEKSNWTNEILNTNIQLKKEIMHWLKKNNSAYIDLYDELKQSYEKVFWDADHHLNAEGHKIISESILKNLKSLHETNQTGSIEN
jgi:hypothetical protein